MVYPIALIGGIEDSKAKPEPNDFVRLDNWTTFRGRFALRSPIFLTTTLTAADANATRALAGVYHDGKLWLAVYRDANDDVRLWELTTTGAFTADRGAIWTSITTTIPRPIMCSFEGGSATAGTKRIYIADYDEQQNTRFWDSTSINTLTVDFDDSGSAESVKFHYVFPYQFHLWGAGFFQGTTGRKEMLRFSQPGLIPAVDPDTLDSVEWFAADFRSAGRRGDKITNLALSGGPMIVFKDRQTYALFGYDSQSWAIRQLSERAGAIGPYASASTGDGLCFFWSERGPHVTDGQTVTDISESVRRHVLEAEVTDKIAVGFSPDDGMVYFAYPSGGSTELDRWVGFDKERKIWSEGAGLATGGGAFQIKHLFVVPSVSLAGPVGAPSSVALTVVDENNIDVTWVNGDTALDTQTEVYFGTSAAPTTLFGSALSSGITTVRLTGLVSKTTYFVRARHKRNAIFSSYSNEPSAKTALSRPTGPLALRLSTGITYKVTNNENLADLVIERKLTSDSGWAVLTTLVSQASGVISYDDTSPTCGLSYDYRSKVTKAGETTSPYSTIASSTACAAPSITSASHSVTVSSSCTITKTKVQISWVGVNLRPEDMVSLYQNIAGAGYTFRATVVAQNLTYQDIWNVKAGATSTSIQYRVDLLDQGGPVVDSDFTTLTNHNVDACLF